jgi:hypothetical protein
MTVMIELVGPLDDDKAGRTPAGAVRDENVNAVGRGSMAKAVPVEGSQAGELSQRSRIEGGGDAALFSRQWGGRECEDGRQRALPFPSPDFAAYDGFVEAVRDELPPSHHSHLPLK